MRVKRRVCTGRQDAEGTKSRKDTEGWAHGCLNGENARNTDDKVWTN